MSGLISVDVQLYIYLCPLSFKNNPNSQYFAINHFNMEPTPNIILCDKKQNSNQSLSKYQISIVAIICVRFMKILSDNTYW